MSEQARIALVTGGSRGLGRAAAIALAAKGNDIIITYQSNQTEAAKTLAEVSAHGRKGVALPLDVSVVGNIPAFVSSVQGALAQNWGADAKLHALVNNAGVGGHEPIGEITEEGFDRLLNIHFKSVVMLTQAILPHMNDGGSIVNLSSGLARFSLPGYAVYGSLKGAIEVFTRYLAKEIGHRKITANVVAPGAIDNDFNKARFDAMPQMREMLASSTALGRVGVSEDIGGIVAFLCSDEAHWINGQRIEATGGVFL
jgi:NAD(P)-dependent dehydrogenase (short-subunit alcohol dehydrogenase family)